MGSSAPVRCCTNMPHAGEGMHSVCTVWVEQDHCTAAQVAGRPARTCSQLVAELQYLGARGRGAGATWCWRGRSGTGRSPGTGVAPECLLGLRGATVGAPLWVALSRGRRVGGEVLGRHPLEEPRLHPVAGHQAPKLGQGASHGFLPRLACKREGCRTCRAHHADCSPTGEVGTSRVHPGGGDLRLGRLHSKRLFSYAPFLRGERLDSGTHRKPAQCGCH
jgi:hypothetical protein